jgi:uncharacterized membrane protein YvbJ
MEKDLDEMSKTMPYTVPEGFFDEMEERLMQEVAPRKTKLKTRNVVLWTSLAVAASLALLLVLRQGWHHSDEASFEQVEMAFNQLSDSDQQLMLELFEEMDELDDY